MKHYLIYFFILISFGIYSQNKIDCIHTKNKSIYRGSILSKNDTLIQLFTLSKNIIFISNTDIDSVTTGNKRYEIRTYKSLGVKKTGWFNVIEPSLRLSNGFGLGLNYQRGYKFSNTISISALVGFMYKEGDRYDYFNQYRMAVVVNYSFYKKGDYPFALFETGLQHIFSDPKLVRAPYWHGGIGYCFNKRNKNSYLFSAGFTQNMNRYKANEFNGFGASPYKDYYSDWYFQYDFVVKMGFKF